MAGEAECQFNTNCWIRGRMVAMTGTFSGTFRAEEVDIVDYANIRNGAVSAYTQFSRKKLEGEEAIQDMTWVVAPSPFGTLLVFTIPLSLRIQNGSNGQSGTFIPPTVTLYRNGEKIFTEDWRVQFQDISLFLSLKIVEFDVPRTDPVTYRIVMTNGTINKGGVPTSTHKLSSKGKVLTSNRKR
jgi:hypothetical protein